MLVRQIKPISAQGCVRRFRRIRIFERCDHGFPAAGIARYGISGQRPIGRDQTPADQWTDKRQKARGIAARIGHKAGRSEEHTSELKSLMRNSYAVFHLEKKKLNQYNDISPPT